MAQITSSAKMPLDADSKKLLGVATDNSGTTELVPIQGGTRTTVNADTVAPMMVQVSNSSAIPTSIAAGSDATAGNTSDAAVVTDTTGTLSGKLRGLVKWAFERMPAALGPATSTTSMPVTQAANTGVAAAAVTVGTSAAALPASPLAHRRLVMVSNQGSVTIYIGPSGVSTSSGFPVDPGQSLSIEVGPGLALYAIARAAGQNVRVLEVS